MNLNNDEKKVHQTVQNIRGKRKTHTKTNRFLLVVGGLRGDGDWRLAPHGHEHLPSGEPLRRGYSASRDGLPRSLRPPRPRPHRAYCRLHRLSGCSAREPVCPCPRES